MTFFSLRYEQARWDFEAAIRLDRTLAPVHVNIGVLDLKAKLTEMYINFILNIFHRFHISFASFKRQRVCLVPFFLISLSRTALQNISFLKYWSFLLFFKITEKIQYRNSHGSDLRPCIFMSCGSLRTIRTCKLTFSIYN